MTIDSVDNKKIKNIRKLNQKKYRDETNEFLVEGIHLVKEAYKEGLLKEVVLEENEEIDQEVEEQTQKEKPEENQEIKEQLQEEKQEENKEQTEE